MKTVSTVLGSILLVACGGGGGGGGGDPSYFVGGSVKNLPGGSTVAISLNGAETLSVSGASNFDFKTPLLTGAAYTVAIASSPPGYSCSVSNGSGSIHLLNVNNASVVCLSNDHQIFENMALTANGGLSSLIVGLPLSGMPTPGSSFIAATFKIAASPALAGTQSATWGTIGLSKSLPTVDLNLQASRILKDGAIVVSPNYPQSSLVSYSGAGIQIDDLAQDQKTIASSSYYSGFTSQALTGNVADSPAEVIMYLGNLFANASLLKPGAKWQSGAAYVRHTANVIGDRISVTDCTGSTTDSNVHSCAFNISLASYVQALPLVGPGKYSTAQGLPIWVADTPSSIGTTSYQVYVELNNNVYKGSLVKDGTQVLYPRVLGQSPTTYWNTSLLFNAAAVGSLQSAITF